LRTDESVRHPNRDLDRHPRLWQDRHRDSRQVWMGNRRRLNVVIAGPGETGEYLARRLVEEEHDVTMLDVSSDRLAELAAHLEVRTCLGHAGSTQALRQAGVDHADVFVATSNRDDANLVSVLKARQLGAHWTAALVEDVEVFDEPTGFYPDFLGIDRVMNTRFLIAREIAKLVRSRGILAIDDIAENRTEVVQFRVPAGTEWTDRPLAERLFLEECLLVALDIRSLCAGAGEALYHASFQVVSLMTTTGFVTDDFDRYPAFSRILLVMLMLVGASAGSTAGGIKVVRPLLLGRLELLTPLALFLPVAWRR